MTSRDKLIGNLCQSNGKGFNLLPGDLLVSALAGMTIEQFTLYLEHYVDGRLREAFGLNGNWRNTNGSID